MMDVDEEVHDLPDLRAGQKMLPDFNYDGTFGDILDNSVFDE